ncbi:SDR family NAD(P)-dependent oxidoreductase [Amorphus sp. MBR-141]
MAMTFEDQVAIVTGGGRGLGRGYAMALAERGARVVIADPGEDADTTAEAIRARGGQAKACKVDVSDFGEVEAMVADVLGEWGRVDIAINNAGILRDRTFAKLDLDDFRAVMDVHLMGSVHLTKAVWPAMRAQQYGRVVFTTSSSGMYGIFGQANYAAAKASMIGLMNALHLEGARDGIRVNCIMPSAATRMTEGLLSPEAERLLVPEAVAPGVLFLVSGEAPSRMILSAGAGVFARVCITETEGILLSGEDLSPETVAARFDEIGDRTGEHVLNSGFEQAEKLTASALRASAR